MFENLTYKRKLQLLIVTSVLFGIFIYQSVLSKTFEAYKRNRELSVKLSEASSAPAELGVLTKKIISLDRLVQSRQTDTSENVHDLLLAFLSRYCKENNTVLKSFPETSSSRQDEFEIQTHIFSIQGNFIDMLQLVYYLEQKLRVGRISSLNFQSVKDMDSKKTLLIATVYLQNIKKIKQ